MRRASNPRRRIANLLLLAGVLALGVWAWSNFQRNVFQDWENWAFDRKIHGQSATVDHYLAAKKERADDAIRTWFGYPRASKPSPPQPQIGSQQKGSQAPQPSLGNGDLIGRLVIPRLQVHAIVREGVGRKTLDLALGHIPGTALPGQKGNVGVAGHRDTLFRSLRKIGKGDLLQFQTLAGSYTYKVDSTQVVGPKDVKVLDPGKYPEMTLVTCYPFDYIGSAPDRFIVQARMVSQDPPGQDAAELGQEAAKLPAKLLHPRDVPPALQAEARPHSAGVTSVSFRVSERHSRQLVPGIWFGLSGTDTTSRSVDGWMWVMPDRRTIWLRNQETHEPVVFYDSRDGNKRELILTNVTGDSVTGYLFVFGRDPGARQTSH